MKFNFERANVLIIQCENQYSCAMAVIATLVAGRDGSTSKDGTSAGVSSAADRQSFLTRRRDADCILIGGNTARIEPYHRTPVPVVVISKSLINPLADNRLAHCWNLAPEPALDRAIKTFGSRIHIEAGSTILTQLIAAGRVDQLELSITEVVGGQNKIDITTLLSHFTIDSERILDGTRMISASRKLES
jgi:riboflavin biosynthesis pyrimidine reductase